MIALVLAASAAPARESAKAAPGRRQAIDLLAQGQTIEQQGDTQAAMNLYQQSVQAAPSPAAYYRMGLLARRAGDKPAALQYFRQALELNPDYELAKMEVGGEATVNVDSIQRESRTIQSLRDAPGSSVAMGDAPVPRSPAVTAPAQPPVPEAPSSPPPSKPARRALEPPQAAVQVFESQPTVVVNETQPAVKLESSQPATDAAAAAPAGQAAAVAQEPRAAEPAPAAAGAEAGGAGNAKAAGGMPSAAAVNRVAFGADAAAQKSSMAFNNDSKVVLGTFAFHRDKGDRYRGAERWVDAAQEYEFALKLNPGDAPTRALYAEALANAGDGALSADQLAKAEREAPDDPKVLYRMGNVYRGQKKLDLAIGAYRRAAELDPSNKFVRNNLGVVYMEKGDYAKAAEQFKKTVELDPKYDKALLNLGIIYDDHLADDAQALKYYEDYLQLGGERSNEVRRWAEAIKGGAR
jgi:tetratricopeptide (TPR) repeat protein